MRPEELQAIAAETVTDVDTACRALGIGRTLGRRRARELGELCEGVRVLACGRRHVVPTRPLLAVLGYGEEEHGCSGCGCGRGHGGDAA